MQGEKYPIAITGSVCSMSRTAPVVFRQSVLENIKLAKETGYDAIEIHLRHPNELDVEQIKACCEEHKISISAIATGLGFVMDKLSMIDDRPEIRELAIQRLIEHIDLCADLNTSVIIGSLRGNIPDFDAYDHYEQYLEVAMLRLVKHAEQRGVPLLLEAINRYEINYLNSVIETTDFVSKCNSPWLQVHIDTFHMNIEDADLVNSIKYCGEKLGYVHLSDSNRMHPGAGHIDFHKVKEVLSEVSYKGYLAVECLPGKVSVETAIAAREFIRDVF